MNKSILGMMLILFAGVEVHAESDPAPCAVVTRAGAALRVIPPKGKIETALLVDQGIACGSIVITQVEPVWIRLQDSTELKLGPSSFLELPDSAAKDLRLYRGSVLVSAPARGADRSYFTPNAELVFQGGVSLLQYLPADRTTVAGCFNRKVTLRNRFHSDAIREISAGEMTRLAVHEGRVEPAHARVMNHSTATEVLVQAGLDAEAREPLVAVVKQVFEDRAKSLVSGIESFGEEAESAGRSIASVPQGAKHVVDPKEAAIVMKLMKDRIYGTETEQARFVPPPIRAGRAPATAPVEDAEKKSQEKKFQTEVKRIEKEIGRMDPDEEGDAE